VKRKYIWYLNACGCILFYPLGFLHCSGKGLLWTGLPASLYTHTQSHLLSSHILPTYPVANDTGRRAWIILATWTPHRVGGNPAPRPGGHGQAGAQLFAFPNALQHHAFRLNWALRACWRLRCDGVAQYAFLLYGSVTLFVPARVPAYAVPCTLPTSIFSSHLLTMDETSLCSPAHLWPVAVPGGRVLVHALRSYALEPTALWTQGLVLEDLLFSLSPLLFWTLQLQCLICLLLYAFSAGRRFLPTFGFSPFGSPPSFCLPAPCLSAWTFTTTFYLLTTRFLFVLGTAVYALLTFCLRFTFVPSLVLEGSPQQGLRYSENFSHGRLTFLHSALCLRLPSILLLLLLSSRHLHFNILHYIAPYAGLL
jgi:hypothetical protein